MNVDLSIIIVNWNAKEVLRECLTSIYSTVKIPFEIIVVDNNSSDGSVSLIKRDFPEVLVIEQSKNLGFSKANNAGFTHARGKYILILNPDTVLLKDAVNRMVQYLKTHSEIGILGPKILQKSGAIDINGKRRLPKVPQEFFRVFLIQKLYNEIVRRVSYLKKISNLYYERSEVCECLSGCCMLLRRDIFEKLRGFDENVPMYLDDNDICYRNRKMGLSNFYLAEAVIVHVGQYSTKKNKNYKIYDVLQIKAQLFYYTKHYGFKTAMVYRLIIAFSVPYLLLLDILTLPYFFCRHRLKERVWVIRKHLQYIKLLVSNDIRCLENGE